jgi:hypothetical protein
MNSREKGKRGERQWRDELRANGYAARRGQQFSGSPDSPDVICEGLPWAHFEVKLVEHLNLSAAMAQARRDAGGKAAFVAHRRNFWPWLVTMDAGRFYRLLRRDRSGEWAARMAAVTPAIACGELAWLACATAGRRVNIQDAMRKVEMDCRNDHLTPAPGKKSGAAPHPACGHLLPRAEKDLSSKGGEGVCQRVAVVSHRDRDGGWLVTMTAETFFKLIGGEFQGDTEGND